MSADTQLPFTTVRTEGLTKLYGRTPALVSVSVAFPMPTSRCERHGTG